MRKALLPACQLALPGLLALAAASLELVCNVLLADPVSLLAVDGLSEHTLVLVHITLHLQQAHVFSVLLLARQGQAIPLNRQVGWSVVLGLALTYSSW